MHNEINKRTVENSDEDYDKNFDNNVQNKAKKQNKKFYSISRMGKSNNIIKRKIRPQH